MTKRQWLFAYTVSNVVHLSWMKESPTLQCFLWWWSVFLLAVWLWLTGDWSDDQSNLETSSVDQIQAGSSHCCSQHGWHHWWVASGHPCSHHMTIIKFDLSIKYRLLVPYWDTLLCFNSSFVEQRTFSNEWINQIVPTINGQDCLKKPLRIIDSLHKPAAHSIKIRGI